MSPPDAARSCSRPFGASATHPILCRTSRRSPRRRTTLDADTISALQAAEPYNIVRIILPRFSNQPAVGDGRTGGDAPSGSGRAGETGPFRTLGPARAPTQPPATSSPDGAATTWWLPTTPLRCTSTNRTFRVVHPTNRPIASPQPADPIQSSVSTQRRLVLRGLMGAVALRAVPRSTPRSCANSSSADCCEFPTPRSDTYTMLGRRSTLPEPTTSVWPSSSTLWSSPASSRSPGRVPGCHASRHRSDQSHGPGSSCGASTTLRACTVAGPPELPVQSR